MIEDIKGKYMFMKKIQNKVTICIGCIVNISRRFKLSRELRVY